MWILILPPPSPISDEIGAKEERTLEIAIVAKKVERWM